VEDAFDEDREVERVSVLVVVSFDPRRGVSSERGNGVHSTSAIARNTTGDQLFESLESGDEGIAI
jgi:hypothetical protein